MLPRILSVTAGIIAGLTILVLGLAVSVVLAWAQRQGWLFTWPRSRALGYLGRISYGVFLLNFPVALVVNAWFTRYASPDAWTQTFGVLVAWLACNLAGAAFHHGVEQRVAGLGRARRPRPVWQFDDPVSRPRVSTSCLTTVRRRGGLSPDIAEAPRRGLGG